MKRENEAEKIIENGKVLFELEPLDKKMSKEKLIDIIVIVLVLLLSSLPIII